MTAAPRICKGWNSGTGEIHLKEKLSIALDAAGINLTKFDASKKRCVFLDSESKAMTVESFGVRIRERIGRKFKDHSEICELTYDPPGLETAVREYAEEKNILIGAPKERVVPEEMAKYVLNADMSSDPVKFFVTKNDLMVRMSGAFYLLTMGLKYEEAIISARHCFRDYDPRGSAGMRESTNRSEVMNVFNTYVPPVWMTHEKFTKTYEPKIPPLFKKLIKHVLPIQSERTYFYAWLYMSVFKRAPTYLVLCGDPGIGKNRLKLLMRALHGQDNTPDGKKSMLTERFNSQVENTTLLYFDELKYNEEVENILKEMQNETLSIEKKGIDATRSTKIFASMVIANNYPRDNYLQFDSRKFVPLQLNPKPLLASMDDAEITELTNMTEFEDSDTFDIAALAEFAKWLKRHGPTFQKRYKNMEYKGPKFWFLAHTSMSKWQSAIIHHFYIEKKKFAPDLVTENGYLWSSIEPLIRRKLHRGYNWPHVENIRRFLAIYCDLDGRKGFETTPLGGLESDFYVKPLLKKVAQPKEEDKGFLDL